jgi:hypothetical protein
MTIAFFFPSLFVKGNFLQYQPQDYMAFKLDALLEKELPLKHKASDLDIASIGLGLFADPNLCAQDILEKRILISNPNLQGALTKLNQQSLCFPSCDMLVGQIVSSSKDPIQVQCNRNNTCPRTRVCTTWGCTSSERERSRLLDVCCDAELSAETCIPILNALQSEQ